MEADASPFDPAHHGWTQRPLDGFFSVVGPLWARREADAWAYGLLADARHGNRAGLVHGGMLMTLIDQAASAVAWEAVDRKRCVTIQLDTHFIAASRPGQFIEARSRVARRTAELVFVQTSLSVQGAEIAVASGIMKVMRKNS
ncbi:MAG: PaaI family thioesterase [Burkholderiaceae bacterium]|nr:PaaI family thioesterase [Burkholderiaceae bacterium]